MNSSNLTAVKRSEARNVGERTGNFSDRIVQKLQAVVSKTVTATWNKLEGEIGVFFIPTGGAR